MLHINRTTKWATFAAVCLIFFAGILRLVQVGAWRQQTHLWPASGR